MDNGPGIRQCVCIQILTFGDANSFHNWDLVLHAKSQCLFLYKNLVHIFELCK